MTTDTIAIQELVGAQPSQDGLAMLLDAKDAQGQPIRITVPYGELMALVSLATVSHSAGTQIQQRPAGIINDFSIAFWSMAGLADTNDIALSLTLRHSGTLSFRLNEVQQRELAAAFAQAVAARSGAGAQPEQ